MHARPTTVTCSTMKEDDLENPQLCMEGDREDELFGAMNCLT